MAEGKVSGDPVAAGVSETCLEKLRMEDLPKGYRPNVGVCILNYDNQIYVASRLNVPGAWQMPQIAAFFS